MKNDLTLRSAIDLLKKGEITSADLVEKYLGSIDRDNKKLNAFLTVNEKALEKAKAIALSVADGAITEALLERENGALVYEIEITKNNLETDVLIDPLTGNVLKIETNEEEKATKEDGASV